MRRLTIAAVALAACLCGCEANFNTTYGAASIRPGSLVQKRSTVKRTEATPTTPAEEESTCENGVCVPPPPK